MRIKPAYFCWAKAQPTMQRGSALISALFIMTLVAIAATAMSMRLQFDIYRTGLTISSDKLYLASQAVPFWAMDLLANKKLRFKYQKQGNEKLDVFPAALQRQYPDVFVTGELYDLQARFNINNLQDSKYHSIFIRILGRLQNKMDPTQRNLITYSLFRWISPYKPENGMDESMSYYLQQHPPYYPSNQAMQSVSELRLVRGITTKIYQAFLPFVTALPTITPININTAPKMILMSLGNGLNQIQVSELIKARGTKGIQTATELGKLLQKLGIPNEQVTIESEYYLSKSVVLSKDTSLTTYTILKRHKDAKGNVSVGIVSEQLNTL